jgi:cysteinyl-tRNA synthetase
MNDDLNAPRAVAALFDFVREANRLLDGSKSAGPELRAAWEWAGQVLDVAGSPTATLSLTSADTVTVTDSVTAVTVGSEEWARGLAVERIQARKSRNFKRSDEIRDELKANGWEVRDTKDGSEVVRMS